MTSTTPSIVRPLAFTTLGCAGEPLDAVLALAREYDVPGIELRTADDEFTHVGLTPAERRSLRTRIEDAGLELLALDSYVQLCAIGDQPLDEHLELAHDLGARGVRVFLRDEADRFGPARAEGSDADQPTAGELRAMDRVASAPREVAVFLETHDTHSSGRSVANLCARLDREVPDHRARVIWDAAHTRRAGETPAETFGLLQPWLEFVQVKDHDSADGYAPVPIGTGDYPIRQLLEALESTDVWLSLEWERKWHPQLPPLAEALTATRSWLPAAG